MKRLISSAVQLNDITAGIEDSKIQNLCTETDVQQMKPHGDTLEVRKFVKGLLELIAGEVILQFYVYILNSPRIRKFNSINF